MKRFGGLLLAQTVGAQHGVREQSGGVRQDCPSSSSVQALHGSCLMSGRSSASARRLAEIRQHCNSDGLLLAQAFPFGGAQHGVREQPRRSLQDAGHGEHDAGPDAWDDEHEHARPLDLCSHSICLTP